MLFHSYQGALDLWFVRRLYTTSYALVKTVYYRGIKNKDTLTKKWMTVMRHCRNESRGSDDWQDINHWHLFSTHKRVSSFDLIEHLSTGVFSAHNFKSAGYAFFKLGSASDPELTLAAKRKLLFSRPPIPFVGSFSFDSSASSGGCTVFCRCHGFCFSVWGFLFTLFDKMVLFNSTSRVKHLEMIWDFWLLLPFGGPRLLLFNVWRGLLV